MRSTFVNRLLVAVAWCSDDWGNIRRAADIILCKDQTHNENENGKDNEIFDHTKEIFSFL
jgi:hypothetical protein